MHKANTSRKLCNADSWSSYSSTTALTALLYSAGHNRSKLFQGEFLPTSVAIDKTLLKEIAKYRPN